MALVTVMSAKGAPGATTTAMLLAALWPRPTILVDADPNGGDVALRLPGEAGRTLDRERGLLSLLPAARRGLGGDVVAPAPADRPRRTARAGRSRRARAVGRGRASSGPSWPRPSPGCRRPTSIVDMGQVHAQSPARHHARARRTPCCGSTGRRPPRVLHTRRRLEGLTDLLAQAAARTGVVAVSGTDQEADLAAAAGGAARGARLGDRLRLGGAGPTCRGDVRGRRGLPPRADPAGPQRSRPRRAAGRATSARSTRWAAASTTGCRTTGRPIAPGAAAGRPGRRQPPAPR